ncbi:MAG: hypothetical protein IME98_05250, partial [Proteobacteria bacterium]|nr:hypothetical protein [Pseudomonadota bacterium]
SLDKVNEDAEKAGETAGKVISIPASAGAGAAGSVKGEDGPNPYNR